MHGQRLGRARRQSILVIAIRHDVGIVAPIVLQAESMSKFMCHCTKGKATRSHRNSTSFITTTYGHPSDIIGARNNYVLTIVNDDEVNIRVNIKLKIVKYRINSVVAKYTTVAWVDIVGRV